MGFLRGLDKKTVGLVVLFLILVLGGFVLVFNNNGTDEKTEKLKNSELVKKEAELICWTEDKFQVFLDKKSKIKLISEKDNSNLYLRIDDEKVELDEKQVKYEILSYTKIHTVDLDHDGIQEIVLSFESEEWELEKFKIVKCINGEWTELKIPQTWEQDDFLQLKKKAEGKVGVTVKQNNYSKTVDFSNVTYLADKGIHARLDRPYKEIRFKDDQIIFVYHLTIDGRAETIGYVKQIIEYNGELQLGKTWIEKECVGNVMMKQIGNFKYRYYDYSSKTIWITYIEPTAKKGISTLEIPAEIDGKMVVKLGTPEREYDEFGAGNLLGVRMERTDENGNPLPPEKQTLVPKKAAKKIAKIKKIVVPNTVKEITSNCFADIEEEKVIDSSNHDKIDLGNE